MVHVGKYSIHGASGLWKTIEKMVLGSFFCCQLMSSNFSYLFCFFWWRGDQIFLSVDIDIFKVVVLFFVCSPLLGEMLQV